MKIIKKISILLVVLSLIINLNNNTYAVERLNNIDITSKTFVIQELGLMLGNGKSLDLEGSITRKEAATIIVRLLDKVDEVQANKEKYMNTNFKDVKGSEWFAPYVGYCSANGIISGYNNTFKPDDLITEKAFLKLMLGVIGYKFDVDFYWNNVYEMAKASDLYIMNNNNKSYTRGDVVNTLYSILKVNDINLKKPLIYKYIDDGKITMDFAVQYGLIEDQVLTTAIESVHPIDETTLEITFNEEIYELKQSKLLIYKTKRIEDNVYCKSIEKKTDKTYVLTTSGKIKPDENYTIYISQIVDSFGTSSSGLKGEFVGYRAPEIESNYFKISKVEVISNNIVYLYFTHPVNENALQSRYYSLEKNDEIIVSGDNTNLIVNKLTTCNNGVALYFTNYNFENEDKYKLYIDGNMVSMYGESLNSNDGDFILFDAVNTNNEVLELEDSKVLSSNCLELKFSKTVNQTIATQVFNYYLTDDRNVAIKILKADIDNSYESEGKIIRLTIDAQFSKYKKYNLMINYINDITRQFSIREKKYPSFTGEYGEITDIEVNNIYPIDANTIAINVDRPLDQDSARDVNNYKLNGITKWAYSAKPTAVYYDKVEDPYLIKLYFDKKYKLKDNDKYRVQIMKSLKDYLGRSQQKTINLEFDHDGTITTNAFIIEAVAIGKQSVKLTFNKDIALDIPNVLGNNYYLFYIENGNEYKKLPISANYIDSKTVVLRFDNLDLDKEYIVSYDLIKDFGGVETDNTSRMYYISVSVDE